MFYGKSGGNEGQGFGRGRNERYDQMVRQQQLIEQKKKEIQARLDAERKKDLKEEVVDSTSVSTSDETHLSSTSGKKMRRAILCSISLSLIARSGRRQMVVYLFYWVTYMHAYVYFVAGW